VAGPPPYSAAVRSPRALVHPQIANANACGAPEARRDLRLRAGRQLVGEGHRWERRASDLPPPRCDLPGRLGAGRGDRDRGVRRAGRPRQQRRHGGCRSPRWVSGAPVAGHLSTSSIGLRPISISPDRWAVSTSPVSGTAPHRTPLPPLAKSRHLPHRALADPPGEPGASGSLTQLGPGDRADTGQAVPTWPVFAWSAAVAAWTAAWRVSRLPPSQAAA